MSDSWMDRPVWWHWMVVHVPHDLVYTENAVLYVGSSSNNDMK